MLTFDFTVTGKPHPRATAINRIACAAEVAMTEEDKRVVRAHAGAERSTEASTIIEVVLPSNLRVRVACGIDETDLVRNARALGGV